MSDAATRRLSRAVTLLALAMAAYYLALGGEYTPRDLRLLRDSLDARAWEYAGMRAQLDSIQARADSLESDPWAIERLARERYGYLRPGELLVRFVERPAEDEAGRGPSED